MKKATFLIFIVGALFILSSCGNKDELADEIVHYYNEEWIPMNDMKEKKLRYPITDLAKLGEHEGSEATTLVEDEIIPIIDSGLERLKAVDTDNKKVKK